jgi:TonB-linked SusC/RagA family outer membrane protein
MKKIYESGKGVCHIPKKLLLVMKLTAFLFVVFTMQVTATVYSQNKKLSLNMQGNSIKEVLQQIEAQSEYRFIYENEKVNLDTKVSIRVTDEVVEKILKQLFEKDGVSYSITDNNLILINPSGNQMKNLGKETINSQQQKSVSGKVTDATGGSLPGVSVVVKGTTTGTITDSNGIFTITTIPSNATLLFSFVGMKSQEVIIGNKTTINITLEDEAIGIEEVVAIGYGTVKKSDLTGSVASISNDDLTVSNSSSIDQMLNGRASGVQITQSSHAPGGGISMRIRGTGSINAGQEPLFVIDGLPIENISTATGAANTGFDGNLPPSNPLNSINPSDIQSVEILKDASATAIYGSRGANGVVLITTKKGKTDKISIEANSTFSVSKVARRLDMLNTSEYIQVMNELAVARGGTPVFNESMIKGIGAGTDWQDQIFRMGTTQNHNLSFSGKSGTTVYYTSFNYYNQDGVVINSNYNRYQGRLNLEHKIGDKFSFGVNFNTSQENNTSLPINGGGINQDADALNSALNTPPIFGVYDETGNYTRPEAGKIVSVTVDNAIALAYGQVAKDKINRTMGNVYAEYAIVPGLKAKMNIGSDRYNKRRDVFESSITTKGKLVGGGAGIVSGELSNTLIEGTLNYSKQFKEKHSLNVMVGNTFQQFDQRTFSASAQGFDSDVIGTNNLGLGTAIYNTVGSNTTKRRLLSYLGRINYSFDNRYLVTGSIRADGSSNFGANNKYGVFPSFSGAWKVSEERFLKGNRVLSTLKLRVGWGQIGNDDIGIGKAITTYSGSGKTILGETQNTAIAPSRIPNPDLKWETSEQTNFGVDFSFLNGRIDGSVDYFLKTTKDLLLDLPVPTTTGFTSFTSNVGQVNNKGFEFSLTSKNLVGAFNWETIFNLATLKNEVGNLGPISEIIVSNSDPGVIVRPGEAMFSYYGYQAEGIFQTAEEVAASAQKAVAKPGVPKWRDVNQDGQITDKDRVILGNPFPNFTFGLTNVFRYKNLELNVFIEGSQGAEMFNWQVVDALYANDPYRNRMAEPLLNRWTANNPTNKWPSGINSSIYQGDKTNSFTVLDASYVRLKTIQLTYNLPSAKIKPLLQSAQIYVAGDNVAMLTDYPGFDPDVNSSGQGNVRADKNAYPAARSIIFGIKIGF